MDYNSVIKSIAVSSVLGFSKDISAYPGIHGEKISFDVDFYTMFDNLKIGLQYEMIEAKKKMAAYLTTCDNADFLYRSMSRKGIMVSDESDAKDYRLPIASSAKAIGFFNEPAKEAYGLYGINYSSIDTLANDSQSMLLLTNERSSNSVSFSILSLFEATMFVSESIKNYRKKTSEYDQFSKSKEATIDILGSMAMAYKDERTSAVQGYLLTNAILAGMEFASKILVNLNTMGFKKSELLSLGESFYSLKFKDFGYDTIDLKTFSATLS